ncbi:nucleotidyltransferase domain-containing protein [Candidatus Woesearchaeota archaeon]|nr:nucleotidyltransferase domain-containing protein [Candidatus Woesearchaeota archaeon]
MAKKKSKDYAAPEPGKANVQDEFSRIAANLPKDAQAKLKEIKKSLDKFKEQLLKKFDKYIIGIALLPPKLSEQQLAALPPEMQMAAMQQPQHVSLQPQMPQMPAAPVSGLPTTAAPLQMPAPAAPPKDAINIVVLVDDSDSKKMAKFELKNKLTAIIIEIAKGIDKKIIPQTLILSELWQSCYDTKYDLLRMIAYSAPFYDTGMIAAIKISEVHKEMVLKKFEKYIVSYVLAGSLIQGKATAKSDIDVFIVVDDTDVKRMTRAELKDKLRAIIIGMGIEAGDATGIKNKLNVQVYILTDFWDSVKEANPIIFTFLRDGVPLYDRGTFMPWKQLLQMGRIKPSSEAIDLYMSSGDQLISRVKYKLKEIGMEDTFWAILTPTQAAIMLYGVPPPTPKETPDVLRDIFVKKEKLLEEEYVKILERNIQLRKDLEHGDKKELTGAEADKVLSDSEKYLKRLDKLFKDLQKIKEEEGVVQTYDRVITVIRDVLRLEGIEKVSDVELITIFEDELISKGKMPAKFLRMLNGILKAKQDYDAGKLTKAEVHKIKKDSDEIIRYLIEHMQRKRGKELEKAKIRVKHGNRFGEVMLIGSDVFIIHDVDHEEKEISRGKLSESGAITSVKRSTLDELEKVLANTEIPPKVFIKEKIFEDLKAIFGKDVEILVNN